MSKTRSFLGWILLASWLMPTALGGQSPPSTRRVDHVDTYHGVEVADPYRWLEQMTSEETRGWMRGQDEYARRFTRAVGIREALAERITRAATVRRVSTPAKRGNRYFLVRFKATGGSGAFESLAMREGIDGEERVIVDGEQVERDTGMRVGRTAPNEHGDVVALSTVRGGSGWETVRFRHVDDGQELADRLTGIHASRSSFAWARDDSGVYYTRYEVPPEGQEVQDRTTPLGIYFHRLGTPQDHDRRVWQAPDPEWVSTHLTTLDARYLVISTRHGSDSGNRIVVVDLSRRGSQPITMFEDASANTRFVGNEGTRFWFYTDRDAPRGRIVAVELGETPSELVDVVPESEHAMDTWSPPAYVGGRFVVGYLVDARLAFKVFDTSGRFMYDLELPYTGSVWTGFVGRADDSEAFYSLSGFADPGTVYRLDVNTGRSTLFARADMQHNPDDYVTAQVFYTSRDGTRIPMFLAHRRDAESNAPRPVLMYGYGHGAWAAAPWYRAFLAAWMDLGGIFALPNTRGGGEYGEEWHQAGVRRNKQTAIDDYLAAAQWLIDEGFTTSELLVAEGQSAGGPLAGAAIVQRPELFGAALFPFPLVDVFRYDQYGGSRWLQRDYGSVSDANDFAAMRVYSPYHNLRDGTCYPATLIGPGDEDELVAPMHAYKFAAQLQHVQGCDNPVLLRVSWGAGHTYGATTEEAVEHWADQLAFLVQVLGLEHSAVPPLGQGR